MAKSKETKSNEIIDDIMNSPIKSREERLSTGVVRKPIDPIKTIMIAENCDKKTAEKIFAKNQAELNKTQKQKAQTEEAAQVKSGNKKSVSAGLKSTRDRIEAMKKEVAAKAKSDKKETPKAPVKETKKEITERVKEAIRTNKKVEVKEKQPKVKKEKVSRRQELFNTENVEMEIPKTTDVIKKALQPVELRPIFDNLKNEIERYIGIFNLELNKIVSVVKKESYKLLPNEKIVNPILEYLHGYKFTYVSGRFSHVTESTMRLHLQFPNIKLFESSDEELIFSVFIENSYDGTSSFKLIPGAYSIKNTYMILFNKIMVSRKIIHQKKDIKQAATDSIDSILLSLKENKEQIEKSILALSKMKLDSDIIAKIHSGFPVGAIYLMNKLGFCESNISEGDFISLMGSLDPTRLQKTSLLNAYKILSHFVTMKVDVKYKAFMLNQLNKVFPL